MWDRPGQACAVRALREWTKQRGSGMGAVGQVAVDVHCDGGNNKNVRSHTIQIKVRRIGQHSDADRKYTIMRDGNIVMVFLSRVVAS
jgi:hypothetical protein